MVISENKTAVDHHAVIANLANHFAVAAMLLVPSFTHELEVVWIERLEADHQGYATATSHDPE